MTMTTPAIPAQYSLADEDGDETGAWRPWMDLGKPYTKGIVGLHEEIDDFFNYMSPTPEEHQMRLVTVQIIKAVIYDLWPEAHVEIFGSFRTGLYLPKSNIDLVVLGKWESLPLRTLRDAFIDSQPRFPARMAKACIIDDVDYGAGPCSVLRITDGQTDIKIDISFNMVHVIKSTELIKGFRAEFPALGKLVLVLKQFIHQRQLNIDANGTGISISSYTLTLMAISFFQLHPRVDPGNIGGNLGVLLIEFFELYGRHFNYSATAISIKDGGTYISKTKIPERSIAKHLLLCIEIENPLLAGNYVCCSTFGTLKMQQAFEFSYVVLTQAINEFSTFRNESSILGRIVCIEPDMVEYRAWIRHAISNPDYNGLSKPNSNVTITNSTSTSTVDALTSKSSFIDANSNFSVSISESLSNHRTTDVVGPFRNPSTQMDVHLEVEPNLHPPVKSTLTAQQDSSATVSATSGSDKQKQSMPMPMMGRQQIFGLINKIVE